MYTMVQALQKYVGVNNTMIAKGVPDPSSSDTSKVDTPPLPSSSRTFL
jgi:hypothetical protein